jgi:hypothetical protein
MTRFAKIAVWPLLAVAAGSLTLAACGDEFAQEGNDAGKLSNLDTKALIITMPDGFSNVAAKCVGTTMLFSAMNANGRAISTVADHPWCADGVLTKEEVDR